MVKPAAMKTTADFTFHPVVRMRCQAIKPGSKHSPGRWLRQFFCLLVVLCCEAIDCVSMASVAEPAASSPAMNTPAQVATNGTPHFNVQGYVIEGKLPLSTNITVPLFSRYTGTNVSLDEIVQAAVDLQAAYLQQGYSTVNIIIAPQRISNGIVPMNVFQGAIAQIVVSGKRYQGSANVNEIAGYTPPPEATATPAPAAAPVVATPAPTPVIVNPAVPATPEEMAKARAAMLQKIAELKTQENDTRVHVVSTNAGPHFDVEKYLVMGNSVLTPDAITRTMTNIDGAYGTNVSFDGIRAAVTELQKTYRARGYVTVAVGLPPQKLTNATVKIQVTEGRLADIIVKGNHYFSSNNVMRALPSLHTNTVLNAMIFQAELNRANANQDRQIYPVISPGPDPGTSDLTLKVKDQLPLHAKVELNNESSPGTPDLRINSSAVYNNLWNLEQSVGVQYSFSPQEYKSSSPYAENAYNDQKDQAGKTIPLYTDLYNSGTRWNFYDQPQVANYSTFYRIPLESPAAIEDVVASNPGSFGYDEATRKFNVPPPSGQPDLTFFASRSTIDSGLLTTSPNANLGFNGTNSLVQNSVQQDLTVNNDLGFRLNIPLPATDDYHSSISAGLDFKDYNLKSYAINGFTTYAGEIDYNSAPPITNSVVSSSFIPVPITVSRMDYLPLSLRYDASLHDSLGLTTWGLGLSANTWYSATTTFSSAVTSTNGITTDLITSTKGRQSLQRISGSSESTGYWVVLNPSFSQQIAIRPDWILTFRADGQWASEPLISNEQFGIGGVNSVRGYREGEVFGDSGYHFSLEQQTAPLMVGYVAGSTPLMLRGSIYTDFARTFLLDPPAGQPNGVLLWGTGVGGVATIGSHWEARFLFSVPLLSDDLTEAYHPFFNFSLTAQF
jgi:hemolysin activation/secretion protein